MRTVAISVFVCVLLAVALLPLIDRNPKMHSEFGKVIHQLKGRWNPFVKKRSGGVPFEAVRWRESTPEVQVRGTWYELLALDGIPAAEIVGFCKKTYRRFWRKRFEEDLNLALDEMGRPHLVTDHGTLTVRRLDTGATTVLTNVQWTFENRMAIVGHALEVWKANGRGRDPRDDLSLQ